MMNILLEIEGKRILAIIMVENLPGLCPTIRWEAELIKQ